MPQLRCFRCRRCHWCWCCGRLAMGNGRQVTGDRRRAVGDGSGGSSCSCLYKTTSVIFSKRLEQKEIHTGSGVQCPRARHCCCGCCCCCCCRPGSVAAMGNGCRQRATRDGVVVGGVATWPRRRAAGAVSTAAAAAAAAAAVEVGVGGG